MDEGDADAKATALREAKEDIGLDPALVSVGTVLEPFLSKVIKILVMLRNITYKAAVRFYQPLIDEQTRKRSVVHSRGRSQPIKSLGSALLAQRDQYSG